MEFHRTSSRPSLPRLSHLWQRYSATRFDKRRVQESIVSPPPPVPPSQFQSQEGKPLLLILSSIKAPEDSSCYIHDRYESQQFFSSYFFTLSCLLMTHIVRLSKFVVLIVTMSVMVRMTFVNYRVAVTLMLMLLLPLLIIAL